MTEKLKNVLWPLGFGILVIVIWQVGILHDVLGFKPFQLIYDNRRLRNAATRINAGYFFDKIK